MYIYIRTYIYMYIHMYVYVHIYIYIYMYTCIHTYIHTFTCINLQAELLEAAAAAVTTPGRNISHKDLSPRSRQAKAREWDNERRKS